MMGVETVDSWRMSSARTTRDSGKRLEQQASSKEQQCGLRWLGRTSPDRESITTSGSDISKQPTVKEGGTLHPVYQCTAPKSSVKPAGHSSVRSRGQHRTSEIQSQTGKRNTSQAPANPRGGDAAQIHGHFKKEFVERLVTKAKQRTKFSSGSEAIIRAIEAKANEDRGIVPARQQYTLPNSLSPREENVGWKAASNTDLQAPTSQITSQDIRQRTSPTNDTHCDTVWISKCERPNNNECSEQSWSSIKAVEEPKTGFILPRVFEAQTKAVDGSCEAELDGGVDEEIRPSEDSSTKHGLLLEQKLYQNNGKLDVRQHVFVHNDEARSLVKPIVENAEKGSARSSDECNMLVNQVTQVRSEFGATLSSPSSSPSGRKLWSLENGKDSLNMLRKKLDNKRSLIDSRSMSRNGMGSAPSGNEKQVKVKGIEVPLLSADSIGEVHSENENLLRSLRLAAAIDQAHFLRALQGAGAVQTSTPNGGDWKRASYPSLPATLSSTKDVRNSKDLQGGKCKFAQQADAREIQSGAASGIPTGTKPLGGPVSVRRRPSDNDSPTTSNKGPLTAREIGRVRMDGSPITKTGSANSPRESSHRSSTASDDSDTSSGGPNSILQILMKKVSMRSSLNSQSDESNASFPSDPASPVSLPTPTPRASSELEQWLRTSNVARSLTDIKKYHLDSPRPCSPGIPSSTVSGSSSRISSWEPRSAEDLPALLQDNKSSMTKSGLRHQPLEQPKLSATKVTAPGSADFGNDILSAPSEAISTDAESQSPRAASPHVCDLQKSETALDPCHNLATPECKSSAGPVGENPRSPGSDDSGSEGSGGTDRSSPVSVLSFKSGRIPLQEDNRLTPLEHKLQELHERIHKSKRDVSNQKRANLEKIKTARRELMLKGSDVVDVTIEEGSLIEDVSKPPRDSIVKSRRHVVEMQVEGKAAFGNRSLVLKNEIVPSVIPELKRLDPSTSLESFDLREVPSCKEELRWDLVYVRDLLLVSAFGQDESKVPKWHSPAMPMNPGLFKNLEEYFKRGKKFPGSQVLSRLALSQDDHLKLRKRIRGVHLDPSTEHQEFVESMNRSQLFDAVNETLAKRLVPHLAVPRPWLTSWAKPVVRPRSTQSGLLVEIWGDISDQLGKNGSMTMDKLKLHQSLEEMVHSDLNKRSHLFPCRELERAAERIGLEIDRRILEELLEETIVYLSQVGDRPCAISE